MSSILDPDHTFSSLSDEVGLDYRLRKAIARMGHIRPTLVQSKCLPLAISSGRDLVVRARTGSGKTLAYCLPALQKILTKKSSAIAATTTTAISALSTTNHEHKSDKNTGGVGATRISSSVLAVIIVPTTELCTQVHQQLQQLTYYCDDVVTTAVLSIGQSRRRNNKGSMASGDHQQQQELDRQEAMLRDHPDVIVATPNGLLTHIRSGALDLQTSVETLVVDEADLVLSLGNSDDMTEIVKSLPRIYQGMLLSATLSPELESLKKVVLHSPITLRLEQDDSLDGGANPALKQFYLRVPKKDKNLVLYVFLKLGLLKGKGLFFVNSTDSSYRLKLFLEQFHIRSAVLNAELPLRSRLNIIEQFNVGNFDYLIATDTSTDCGGGVGRMASSLEGSYDDSDDRDGKNHDDDDDDDDDDDKSNKRNSNNSNRHDDSKNIESKTKRESQRHAMEKTKKKVQYSDTGDDYGVSRGMDFHRVSFVVNFDIPTNPKSYAHRIGRTARGVANGVALTFVHMNSSEHESILLSLQESQPKLTAGADGVPNFMIPGEQLQPATANTDNNTGTEQQRYPQPVPLDFDLQEIEGFRYRVEDVQRAVTKIAVRETRAAELKAEILNSDRLQGHFEENPADFQLLVHDRLATNVSKVQAHLKHVPKYLLPRGMQVANLNKKKRKKKNHTNDKKAGGNDPLRNYYGPSSGADGEQEADPLADFMDADDADDDVNKDNNKTIGGEPASKKHKENEKRVFADTKDGTGYSTSGRRAWQEKHRKGPFNNKKKTSKYKPLGM